MNAIEADTECSGHKVTQVYTQSSSLDYKEWTFNEALEGNLNSYGCQVGSVNM